MKLNVWYLDDEPELLELVSDYLSSDKVQFKTFDQADSLYNELKQNTPDVIIIDHRLPGTSGIDVATKVDELVPSKIPKILVSGDFHYLPNKVFARVFGKPFEFDEIIKYLNNQHSEKIQTQAALHKVA